MTGALVWSALALLSPVRSASRNRAPLRGARRSAHSQRLHPLSRPTQLAAPSASASCLAHAHPTVTSRSANFETTRRAISVRTPHPRSRRPLHSPSRAPLVAVRLWCAVPGGLRALHCRDGVADMARLSRSESNLQLVRFAVTINTPAREAGERTRTWPRYTCAPAFCSWDVCGSLRMRVDRS